MTVAQCCCCDWQGLNGLCLFFLKTNTDCKITVENIASEVTFMWMDCSDGNIIEGFESIMSKILVPVLKSQKVRRMSILLFFYNLLTGVLLIVESYDDLHAKYENN